MAKILLVEDEENFGSVLRDILKMNNHQVSWCMNGLQGYNTFKKEQFDLCLLDVMMPEKDGFTLASDIRSINSSVPILFLTARGKTEDIIKGLKIGAADYITKPCDSEVLLLKIDIALRTVLQKKAQSTFNFGDFNFDSATRILRNGHTIQHKLSPKEGAVLQMLLNYPNEVVKRTTILEEVWQEKSYFTTRSMDVYISKLRKYLSADKTIQIENIHSEGFRLRY